MSLQPLTEHASEWLRGDGPERDVVISSRVRLARNVAGFPFLSKASEAQRADLVRLCRDRVLECDASPRWFWVDLRESPSADRQLLLERHLISKHHSESRQPRGAAISEDESIAVMVNEEDHLRIQVLRSGIQMEDAYAAADRVDDALESKLDFAYSSRFGYLTACPTNVGTGIRVSVMLHLPALEMTGEIDKVKRAATEMYLAIRGYHGEGTEAVGDLFQVSNQTTLGRTESEILADFQDQVIPRIIEYEQRARQALAERRADVLDDRVYRAWGVLTHARLLGSDETLRLLSHVRLGVCMNRLDGVRLADVNELFLLTQPSHLQKLAKQALDGDERKRFRAAFVRQRLGV